jgi:Cytosine/adenosine deaminases
MIDYSLEEKEFFMKEALKEAQKAFDNGEVPIGAVVVKDNTIIARSFNKRELENHATAHAEINVINQANDFIKNWRLLDCALFVTIEPCIMCAGAIGLARLPRLYYGASNAKFGGVDSLYQILRDDRLNHRLEVESGILEDACANIMQDFFRARRKKSSML